MTLPENVARERMQGETIRAAENILARGGKRHPDRWWLSFATDEGFRGVAIVHAGDFVEAVIQAQLHDCDPGGEVRGFLVPASISIAEHWKYRVLTRAEAKECETEGQHA